MPRPDHPPSYEGEMAMTQSRMVLNEDDYPNVDFYAEVYVATLIPKQDGLKLEWVRRATWIQIPVCSMWELAEGAQVPLRSIDIQDHEY